MSTHFSMGAINKDTSNYEYPKIASKKNKYKCPSCDKDVIFRNGKIKAPHYAHKQSVSPCFYYDKPTESQIHKDAKMLLKSLLDNKQRICIRKTCKYCKFEKEDCRERDNLIASELTDDYYSENAKAFIEYKFNHNNSTRSADVAIVENDKIKCIFEICYKNKTKEENRPEPWVEIKAADLINIVNSRNVDDDFISIDCIRDYKCDYCIECEENEKKEYLINKQKEYLINKHKELERERQREHREREYQKREYQKSIERERENEYQKSREIQREIEKQEREKREIEKQEREKREIEKQERELKKLMEWNNKCPQCNINYCKCDTPIFIINYNKKICSCCKKRKCNCAKITSFFSKINGIP